jgi:hypothetical protein
MTKERKRRKDAVGYKFKLYGLATCTIHLSDKDMRAKNYIYEAVIMREAKKVTGRSQALFSLYRDIHKSQSATTVFGMRAICADDFNAENHLCKLEIHQEGLSEDSTVEEI